MFVNALQLQIKFDRVVMAGAHGDFLPPDYCGGSKISIGRRVNHNAINTAISERLTAQIKRRRVEIEQISKTKLTTLRSGCIAFAFCSRPSYSAVREREIGNNFF